MLYLLQETLMEGHSTARRSNSATALSNNDELDRNLTYLCDHVRREGFQSGAFSDIVVQVLGSTYHLHRLIISRSSYFRNMLHGPWKEATAPVVSVQVDDENVNQEAIAIALGYMYGNNPELTESNAFRVLAAACFLDLQDLCSICTDFIIADLWTSNFLAYQMFAESQDYGVHGERVRQACWGYLCQSGALELREVLPKLSSPTLLALLTSDHLWVPNEEVRFELALYVFLAKVADQLTDLGQTSELESQVDLVKQNTGKLLLETELRNTNGDNCSERQETSPWDLEELDCSLINHQTVHNSEQVKLKHNCHSQESRDDYPCNGKQRSFLINLFSEPIEFTRDTQNGSKSNQAMKVEVVQERQSAQGLCCGSNNDDDVNNTWTSARQMQHCSLLYNCINKGSRKVPVPVWGGRSVSRRGDETFTGATFGINNEDFDTFVKIFAGGSLLYSNLSFEMLLDVRKHLEELGFPCKAVSDGLWLQMLLNNKVQEMGAGICKNCCLTNMLCTCNHLCGLPHGNSPPLPHTPDRTRNGRLGNVENLYFAEARDEGAGLYGPAHVQVRGPNDGLAGIGRGATFVPSTAWPPTRFVFSRVPCGLGTRNYQQSPALEEPDTRVNGDSVGDGLTVLMGLGQSSRRILHSEPDMRSCEDVHHRLDSNHSSIASRSGIPIHMGECENDRKSLCEEAESSIILDTRTPLHHFPPYRFGVEFDHVHMLSDGQVKHSPEVFYAGSQWKVSIQAFSEEDPHGHRTLGLFLHRRKAEATDIYRKVHTYIDNREKVMARYQLICPSKKEVMVFGSFEQAGTLLPKAPKGWGWRTALLFDDLPDLVQGGVLRIVAIVQLV